MGEAVEGQRCDIVFPVYVWSTERGYENKMGTELWIHKVDRSTMPVNCVLRTMQDCSSI